MTTTRARKQAAPKEPPADALVMAPTTPPAVDQRLVNLPLDVIEPNPRNPRRDLGDLTGLVASIQALGILEPLLVELIEDGPVAPRRVVLLAGHRRLAAAQLAELDEVPCIVRSSTRGPAERLEMALVENLQREGLAPLDEAEGYSELVRLGLSQRAIADRVGCSQSHVSKRLALLDLPGHVQARITKGTLPLEAAAALVRLKDFPDKLKKAAGEDPSKIAYAVERAEQDIAWETKAAELIDVAKGKGWAVVEAPADPYNRTGRSYKTLARWGYSEAELDVDVSKHETEPCHGVMIPTKRAWPYLETPSATSVCTDPARHGPKGGSKLKAKAQPKPKDPHAEARAKADAERARENADRQAAAEARFAVLTKAVADHRNTRGRSSAAMTLTLASIVGRGLTELDVHSAALAAQLLGIPTGDDEDTWYEVLESYANAGDHELHRAALAFALADAETVLRSPWRHSFSDPSIARHFAYLATLGYEPSPWEKAKLDEAAEASRAD